MNKVNSSIEINPNLKTSDMDYWDLDKVNNELEKFFDQYRETYLNNNRFHGYGYIVSIEQTSFTEKDLNKSSEKMQDLSDKFNKLQDDKVVNVFKDFFDLFQRSPSVYTLLSDLIEIYNSDVKFHTFYDRKDIESDKKMKLLERSLDIFRHLLNRDEVLESIIKDRREKLPLMLLNENSFLQYLKAHPELLVANKKQKVMDSILQQLRNNQR